MDGLVALRALVDNHALPKSLSDVRIKRLAKLNGVSIHNGNVTYPADNFIFIDQGEGQRSTVFSHKADLSLHLGDDGAAALRALL